MMKRLSEVSKLYVKRLISLGWEDQLPGGLADEYSPDDFDPEDVDEGVEVEMEHTDDPDIATEITMDHLVETQRPDKEDGKINSDYYTFLEHMEHIIEEQNKK